MLFIICYTGWPRKNATTLIVNFKGIINKTEFCIINPMLSQKIAEKNVYIHSLPLSDLYC